MTGLVRPSPPQLRPLLPGCCLLRGGWVQHCPEHCWGGRRGQGCRVCRDPVQGRGRGWAEDWSWWRLPRTRWRPSWTSPRGGSGRPAGRLLLLGEGRGHLRRPRAVAVVGGGGEQPQGVQLDAGQVGTLHPRGVELQLRGVPPLPLLVSLAKTLQGDVYVGRIIVETFYRSVEGEDAACLVSGRTQYDREVLNQIFVILPFLSQNSLLGVINQPSNISTLNY